MKGLHLNLSGSGLSLTAGVRGASVTLGRKGTYLNTGIPGTGLYNRTKIGESSSTHSSSTPLDRIVAQTGLDPEAKLNVSIELNDKGVPILTITSGGSIIYNETIINRVKHSDRYKKSVEELIKKRKKEIDEETDKFIKIFQYTPEIIPENIIREELKKLKPQVYVAKEFDFVQPEKQLTKKELMIEAKQKINKIFFWKNKTLREKYVEENIEQRFKNKTDDWEKIKQLFIEKESSIKVNKDKEFNDEYNETRKELEEVLKGNNEYVEGRIETILNEITLPVEFTVNYDYHPDIHQLKIDLHLPQTEDLPQERANILASGKLSIKHKTQKEIKYEYAQCVCGIAFYLSGTFFNVSTNISDIVISGCLERINKATGNLESQYIYSVKFSRVKFATLNFTNIDPLKSFSNFENELNVSNDNEFKIITPL